MSDELFNPFEQACDLLQSWLDQLEEVRVTAAGLLADSRGRQRLSPIADNQRRARIIEAAERAAALNKCCLELEELLAEWEEARGWRLSTPTTGDPQPASLSEDSSPEPF